ncbi:NAD-dependent DNA ligase [Pseudomonadota bacterium]|jgi:NAD-dependent DNA ligase
MASDSSTSLKQSLGELLGLARGLMADQELTNSEIRFLNEWLEERYVMTSSFPGNVIHERIKEVLADGVITEEERSHLVETLNLLIEDRLEDLAEQVDLTELWFDEVGLIEFQQARFCLTGNFVYGPKDVCKTVIEQRGGIVKSKVGDEIQFLVVGGLGVDEWRTGGLGTEIEQAMRLRATGKKVKIIPEDSWVELL